MVPKTIGRGWLASQADQTWHESGLRVGGASKLGDSESSQVDYL